MLQVVYKITFTYAGTNFYGLERQKQLKTVAGCFEAVVNKLFGNVKVIYASRTDRGVSALNQVASFESDKTFNLNTLKYKFNRMLDDDIRVKLIEIAPLNFRANSNVKEKTYLYSLMLAQTLYPIEGQFSALCYQKLDIKKIKRASKQFLGTHDFSAFCAADCEKENKVRTIYKFKVEHKKIRQNGLTFEKLNFYITGNGFLQHMVRIIVGTLIDIGTGKLDAHSLPQIFSLKTRTYTQNTMPSKGLTLVEIKYK